MSRTRMHVLVDGIAYGRQRFGGINTLFNEILPRLAARPDTVVEMLLPPACKGTPPATPVRRARRQWLPTRTGVNWRLDQRLEPVLTAVNRHLVALRARVHRAVVFQSTYFTSLPARIPHVGLALDMNHELFPEAYANPFGTWLRRVYPEYLERSTRIIAISRKTRDDVVRFYRIDGARIDVVHLATNPETFYVDRDPRHVALLDRLGAGPPYLLYVGGRYEGYKNFARLLEALARGRRRTALGLVVAGPAWNGDEQRRLRDLGLERAVCLVEDPDDATLRVLYNFATAFVYPSRHEGFGVPLLEAMACGTPIVAADTAVFREVAEDVPLYFDPDDTAGLVTAIEASLDAERRQECVDRGLKRVTRFSWEACADEVHRVYQQALA